MPEISGYMAQAATKRSRAPSVAAILLAIGLLLGLRGTPVRASAITAAPGAIVQLPSTLGAKTSANSLSIAPASDATFTPAQTGNPVSVTPTIQNASYVSGNCMGGFQAVALGTTASVLNQTMLASKAGLVTAKVIYEFSANPTSSTCTDKGTFTLNSADVSKLMTPPFSLTPATSTGATATSAAQTSQGLGIPSGGTIYVAIVETTTETPATTGDLVLGVSGF